MGLSCCDPIGGQQFQDQLLCDLSSFWFNVFVVVLLLIPEIPGSTAV
jgi:hypothetical protein